MPLDDSRHSFRPRWTAIVAVVVALAMLAIAVRVARPEWVSGLFGSRGDRPELRELIAAVANEPTRLVEGRLTGGFKYAPPPSPTRGPDVREVPPDIRIAAANIEKRRRTLEQPQTEAASGIAHLAQGDLDAAVTALEHAVAGAPSVANYQSDLAAAYYARGKRDDSAVDYPKSLAAAERARRLDPSLSEAWFNRAVALEAMHLGQGTSEAWRDYLRLDSSSPWAVEARGSKAVPVVTGNWDEIKTQLRSAVRADSQDQIGLLANRGPQASRELFEDELALQWFERRVRPTADGETGTASNGTAALAAILGERGDLLPRETIARSTPVNAEQSITKGLAAYRKGRELYARGHYEESAPHFRLSAVELHRAGSPFGAWADFYAGVVTYFSGELDSARRALEPVRDMAARRSYTAVRGRSEWMLGLIAVGQAQYASALRHYEVALDCFVQLNEVENVAAVHNLEAEAFRDLGQIDVAWRHQFLALSMPGVRPVRRQPILLNASIAAVDGGLPEAARYFQDAVIEVASTSGLQNLVVEGYLRRAGILMDLGHRDAAREDMTRATAALSSVSDLGLMRRLRAEAETQTADIIEQTDPTGAIAALTDALAFFGREGRDRRIVRLFLKRGRLYARQEMQPQAQADFESGIAQLESNRAMLADDPAIRASYLNESWGLYADLAALHVVSGQTDLAFATLERARGRIVWERLHGGAPTAPVSPAELAERIPAGTCLLYYASLKDQLLIWAITQRRVSFKRMPVSESLLARARDRLQEAMDISPQSELFQMLVEPVREDVGRSHRLVIVPDGVLATVPFAGLFDAGSKTFLVESHSLSTFPAARVYAESIRRTPAEGPPRSAIVFAAPLAAGDSAVPRLPQLQNAEKEAEAVARLYPRASVFNGVDATRARFIEQTGAFDVVHIAAHSVANPRSPLLSAIVLAPRDADDSGLLTVGELARLRFPGTRLVVLAACRTALGANFRGEGVLSLATPFLAAGVPSVIGTLWDVDDRASGILLPIVHEHILHGESTADALRAAQLFLLRSGDSRLRATSAWAPFTAFGS